MRLIDADALYVRGSIQTSMDFDAGVLHVLDLIDHAPTIEAEPITLESAIDYLNSIGWLREHDRVLTERSEPVRMTGGNDGKVFICECSECCGARFVFLGDDWPKYYQNCGARMDGEIEREEEGEPNFPWD